MKINIQKLTKRGIPVLSCFVLLLFFLASPISASAAEVEQTIDLLTASEYTISGPGVFPNGTVFPSPSTSGFDTYIVQWAWQPLVDGHPSSVTVSFRIDETPPSSESVVFRLNKGLSSTYLDLLSQDGDVYTYSGFIDVGSFDDGVIFQVFGGPYTQCEIISCTCTVLVDVPDEPTPGSGGGDGSSGSGVSLPDLLDRFLSIATSVFVFIGTIADSIVNTPLLLFTTGFLFLGGCVGIFGRLLSRD